MPKHKKNRKQKMQASIKQHTVMQTTLPSSESIAGKQTIKMPEKFSAGSQFALLSTHAHIIKALRKTAIFSIGILIFEIVLFFLLKTHTIVLFNLSY